MNGDAGPIEVGLEKSIEETVSRTYPLSAKNELELNKRFKYHTPQPDQLPRYEMIRSMALSMAILIWRYTPPSREQALALTKLEEAVMHANSAIAREPRGLVPFEESPDAVKPDDKTTKTEEVAQIERGLEGRTAGPEVSRR